jgi:hypothetical protein
LRYWTRANESSYLKHARELLDYTLHGLAFDDHDMGLMLREQTGYLAPTSSSTLSWSMISAENLNSPTRWIYNLKSQFC